MLLFYRPDPDAQYLPAEGFTIVDDAACKAISAIKILQREGWLDILWRSVHQLFMAGLTVIYCIWRWKESGNRSSVGSSISTLQTCASTLSAMSKTSRGGARCRDIFDSLSSVTVDWLFSSDGHGSRRDRVEFDKQVEEMLMGL